MAILSVGYAGREIDGFVTRLCDAGVTDLIDVRYTPISRKRGFSKTALSEHLVAAGIKYHHVKRLGAPKDMRVQLAESHDFEEFAKAYRDHLRTKDEDLGFVFEIVRSGVACLLCVEADPERCHRGILTETIQVRLGEEIRHL